MRRLSLVVSGLVILSRPIPSFREAASENRQRRSGVGRDEYKIQVLSGQRIKICPADLCVRDIDDVCAWAVVMMMIMMYTR